MHSIVMHKHATVNNNALNTIMSNDLQGMAY